jgi:thiol-disulfide isomerase/thioredoxin
MSLHGQLCIRAVAIACSCVGFAAALAAEQKGNNGCLTGRVLDVDGQPVAGATIRVMIARGLDAAEGDRLRTGTSDAEGRYRVEVPRGHAMCLSMEPPAGYYEKSTGIRQFATSAASPEHTLDFTLERGPSLALELGADLQAAESAYLFREKPEFFVYMARLKPSEPPRVTLPPDGGKTQLSILEDGFQPLAQATIDAEAGFRADAAREVLPEGGLKYTAIDADGRRATIDGAKTKLVDKQLTLELDGANRPKLRTLSIAGRVLDDRQQPLGQAEVRFGAGSLSGASNSTPFATRTAADGSFKLEATTVADAEQFFLIVTADGTPGIVTERTRIRKGTDAYEVPPIKLAAGHSARLRVVGPGGEPLEGAWVEVGDAYLSSANFAKTDAEGRVTAHNLPEGVSSVTARYGEMSRSTKVVVASDPGAVDEMTLTLALPLTPEQLALRQAGIAKPEKMPDPPPVGSKAPELSIAAWTDGQPRKLSDYRGKVVVLEFWGTWCSACMNAIPASKEVVAKYADNPDVVFLGIHSAGTDMAQVKALKRVKDWDLPTGLDQGEDLLEGRTSRAYGASGWPTIVIIDRQGNVAHNSNLEKWDLVTLAIEIGRVEKALDLPPEDPTASDDEKIARANKLNAFRVSELIDAALAK